MKGTSIVLLLTILVVPISSLLLKNSNNIIKLRKQSKSSSLHVTNKNDIKIDKSLIKSSS